MGVVVGERGLDGVVVGGTLDGCGGGWNIRWEWWWVEH